MGEERRREIERCTVGEGDIDEETYRDRKIYKQRNRRPGEVTRLRKTGDNQRRRQRQKERKGRNK